MIIIIIIIMCVYIYIYLVIYVAHLPLLRRSYRCRCCFSSQQLLEKGLGCKMYPISQFNYDECFYSLGTNLPGLMRALATA